MGLFIQTEMIPEFLAKREWKQVTTTVSALVSCFLGAWFSAGYLLQIFNLARRTWVAIDQQLNQFIQSEHQSSQYCQNFVKLYEINYTII